MDRQLRDRLERAQADLQSAQKELAAARNRIAVLEAVLEAQTAAADVRDLFAAAMTTKFQPVAPASYGAIAVVLLLGFVLMLVIV